MKPPRHLRLNLRLNQREFAKVRRAARLAGETPGTFARDSLIRQADRMVGRKASSRRGGSDE